MGRSCSEEKEMTNIDSVVCCGRTSFVVDEYIQSGRWEDIESGTQRETLGDAVRWGI